ncbi:AAA family ATPase, partial [Chloroflexota bacterium]
MLKLPLKHLSVRVPWHDNGWNGTVCKNPRENGSCLVLKNIQPKKDVDQEEVIAGKPFAGLSESELPPCIKERAMFMCPEELITRTKHPYSESNEAYSHYRETPLEIPTFSAPIVPFRWAMKNAENHRSEIADELGLAYDPEKEPDLGFKTIWVQNHENQRELLDTFISAVEPQKSLIFFYAKHVPLSETANRILMGAGTVKHFYDIKEYVYEPKIPGKQSYIWERVVEHTIRGNWQEGFDGGFILPYQELLELQTSGAELNLESLVAVAPSWDEFSYGAEHVSHSTAIDALNILATTLRKMEQPLGRSFEKEYQWIDDRISELWNMRGAFPGIGPVLTAFGLREGNFIAWEIAKEIEKKHPDPAVVDTWILVDQMFQKPGAILPTHLAKKVGTVICAAWQALDSDTRSYLKLLSRLELNNKQAEAFFDADNRNKNGIEAHTTKDFLENPYLLFETGINCRINVNLATVDKAMLSAEKIRQVLPVPEPSTINDPLDARRLRAAVIQVLEDGSEEGHSLLPEYLLIERANALALDPEINLKSHILQAVETHLSSKIIVTEATAELPKFYQLWRLADIKKIIQDFVEKRHTKGQRLNVQVDWTCLVDSKLGIINSSLPEVVRTIEAKARAEKVAALHELASARFSVMVGPAGTGKTTVLDILCKLPEIASKGVLKLAPTGKARVKLGVGAETVAEFLYDHNRYDGETKRYFMKDGDYYSGDKTVIVDEASMLTEDQLAALINCLSGVERFILVGDFRQLPPIGTGRPFVDIVTYLQEGIDAQDWPRVGKGYAELSVICRQRPSLTANDYERMDIR